MIPISTAVGDPAWYHDFSGDYNYIFKDKRQIVNGIRYLPIIKCGKSAQSCKGPDLCRHKTTAPACPFLTSYRDNLEKLNIQNIINDFNYLASAYQNYGGIKDEIIIVLIVYETPKNLCSERNALINYFNSHNIECKELDYPIV